MAKKPTKSEKEFRVNQVVRMLINCASRSSIVQFVAKEWGLSARTADKYIADARLVLREDANIDRHDYLASQAADARHHRSEVGEGRSVQQCNRRSEASIRIACLNKH